MTPGATTRTTERWTTRAEPIAGRVLRERLKAFVDTADLREPPLSDLNIAVSEAISNAVLHGYADADEPGPVEITAGLSDAELRLVIADSGSGWQAHPTGDGLGLGLPLIAAVADGCEIREREPHGTELHLRFAR